MFVYFRYFNFNFFTVGAFYYLLGNLPPKYRSSLKSIQLIALVKSSFISTYGIDRILKPLVSDLKQLEAVSYTSALTCTADIAWLQSLPAIVTL